MDDYGQALFIDLFTVVACTGLLLRFGNLRFSHPATPYLAFHVHTVTTRLAGLVNGASPLYANAPGWFDQVMPGELTRAALYCDLAFWSVTVVWIFVRRSGQQDPLIEPSLKLEPRIFRPILAVAFVIGLVGFRVVAQIPGVQSYDGLDPSSPWAASSYLIILPSWFGLAALGYVYYYGFSRASTAVLVTYLALMAVQGGMRSRFVIGLILAIQIWVDRRDRRWPSRSMVLALVATALLFFPMKTLGRMVQTGANVSEISTAFSESVTEVTEGAAPDQMFLDEMASALTLLDIRDHKYFGSIYLPLLTLPIPRPWWPEKPGLADFMAEISTSRRPMGVSGMIVTYLGESYANFGIAGIFLVPPLLAYLLALFHRRAYALPLDSVFRFSYVLLSANLIQVYRDGLLSVFIFTFVNMMPLAAIVLAHLGHSFIRKRVRGEARLAGALFLQTPEGPEKPRT